MDEALATTPALQAYRDERGRNWLHMCCMAKPKNSHAASLRTAEVLLRHYDVNEPAFVEGTWKATPLWHAIGFGRNLRLAELLLWRKSDPNHCLFAAAYNDDAYAVRLLAGAGADLEQFAEGETALLHAVQYSRFKGAEALLAAGADPNAKDAKGRTALHRMLRKNIDPKFFRLFAEHGARIDIPDTDGRTVAEILRRKRDPKFQRIAERLAEGARSVAR
ncbi:MAG TPA: ankyrin repeat domain-containing protein [Gammaproteobacteria bacterium]